MRTFICVASVRFLTVAACLFSLVPTTAGQTLDSPPQIGLHWSASGRVMQIDYTVKKTQRPSRDFPDRAPIDPNDPSKGYIVFPHGTTTSSGTILFGPEAIRIELDSVTGARPPGSTRFSSQPLQMSYLSPSRRDEYQFDPVTNRRSGVIRSQALPQTHGLHIALGRAELFGRGLLTPGEAARYRAIAGSSPSERLFVRTDDVGREHRWWVDNASSFPFRYEVSKDGVLIFRSVSDGTGTTSEDDTLPAVPQIVRQALFGDDGDGPVERVVHVYTITQASQWNAPADTTADSAPEAPVMISFPVGTQILDAKTGVQFEVVDESKRLTDAILAQAYIDREERTLQAEAEFRSGIKDAFSSPVKGSGSGWVKWWAVGVGALFIGFMLAAYWLIRSSKRTG